MFFMDIAPAIEAMIKINKVEFNYEKKNSDNGSDNRYSLSANNASQKKTTTENQIDNYPIENSLDDPNNEANKKEDGR